MEKKAFIILSLCVCSLTITACHNNKEDTPIEHTTTLTAEAESSDNTAEITLPEYENLEQSASPGKEITHDKVTITPHEAETVSENDQSSISEQETTEGKMLYSDYLESIGYIGEDIRDTCINYMPDISESLYNQIITDGSYETAQEKLYNTLGEYCQYTFCKEYSGIALIFASSSDIAVTISYDENGSVNIGPPQSVYTENSPGFIDDYLGIEKPIQFKSIETKLLKEGRTGLYRLIDCKGCVCTFQDIVTDEQFQMTCELNQ